MERTEIDAVRRMPLADFLARLGHEPVRRSGNELWYLAPYRGERTSSFRVNVAKQLWYDFGLGKGGDIFTLAGEFLQSDDFMKQAKFIAEVCVGNGILPLAFRTWQVAMKSEADISRVAYLRSLYHW